MSTLVLAWVMFSHWIADFCMQTRKQAHAKSSDIKQLSYHVLTYVLTLFVFLSLGPQSINVFGIPLYCLGNGAAHWITDYFTSRASKRAWKAGNEHGFWMIIGFDQLVHTLCLIVSLKILV